VVSNTQSPAEGWQEHWIRDLRVKYFGLDHGKLENVVTTVPSVFWSLWLCWWTEDQPLWWEIPLLTKDWWCFLSLQWTFKYEVYFSEVLVSPWPRGSCLSTPACFSSSVQLWHTQACVWCWEEGGTWEDIWAEKWHWALS